MWLHFGGPNCSWYILIIENYQMWLELFAHNKSNTLHYLATIFDGNAISNHINARKCWLQTLFSQKAYVHIHVC
jgi:hypothetical protein